MNCVKFQFIDPVITISVNFLDQQGSFPNYEKIQFSGAWNVTQGFNPTRRLQWGLAKNCENLVLPYSVRSNRENWKPFSQDALCNRYKLFSLSTYYDTPGQEQFMGSTPVAGTYTLCVGGTVYVTDYVFFIRSGSFGTQEENWWTYKNLKPWNIHDPFYGRNLSMWNTIPESQKVIYAQIIGGYYDPNSGLFQPQVYIPATFATNATGEVAQLQYYGDPAGTATLTMQFNRGA